MDVLKDRQIDQWYRRLLPCHCDILKTKAIFQSNRRKATAGDIKFNNLRNLLSTCRGAMINLHLELSFMILL